MSITEIKEKKLANISPFHTKQENRNIIEYWWPNAGDMILCYEDAIATDKASVMPLPEWALDEIYDYFKDTGSCDNHFGGTIDFLKQFTIESNGCKDNQWRVGKIIAVNHKTEEKIIYRPS